MSVHRKMYRGTVILGILLMLLAGPLAANAFPTTLPERASPVGPEGAVVRIHLTTREDVPLLASLGVDIWKVEQEEMLLIGLVGPQLYEELLARGFTVKIDDELTQNLLVPPDYPCYRTVEEILDHMVVVSDTYPQLAELVDYGDSWEKVQDPGQGYDIMAMRITNEAISGTKPVLLIVSEHHAREMVVPEVADFFIDYLTGGFRGEGGYGVDPDVTWLVDHREIWIVPLVNPDGRKMVEPSGWWWRKNTNDTINPGCAWPPTYYDHYGVDNNRNYSYMWAYDDSGSSSDPCAQGYRGVAAASEPETQAIVALGNDVFPDPADDTGMMITIHSAVPAILIPWSYATPDLAPDDAALRAIGCKWAIYSNYPVGRAGELLWYYPNGTTDDWFYGELDVASFTPELGYDFFEPCWGDEFPWNIWDENLPSFVHAAKTVAPDPYLTVYGPDAHTLAVNPDPVQAGTPVQLTATIEDERLLNSYCSVPERPVAAAEYFIDAPGTDGMGTPLSPSDGSWGEILEEAEAVVDTSGLAPGTHYLLVHGQSDDGYWGPFTAVFVHVEEGCTPVQIEEVLTETVGCTVTFSAELTGTAPFSYNWDFGPLGGSDQPSTTVDFGVSGTYPFTLTATNCGGTASATLSDTVTVSCAPPCEPVTGVTVDGPADLLVGETGIYTATSTPPTATLPVTFTWDNGRSFGTATVSSTAAYSWTVPGAYALTVTATNACGEAADTLVVLVCQPVEEVMIAGPASLLVGETGSYTATYTPPTATLPVTFTWDNGRSFGTATVSSTAAYSWTTVGTYTLAVTVTNGCAVISGSFVVEVGAVPYRIYLPVVLKGMGANY